MPIQGELKEVYLKPAEILAMTNGGYDIFMYYLGSVKRVMKRPWGRPEKHPSWGIYYNLGIWFWKDAAREESGTAIQFVERFFSLSFKDAIDKICWDFALTPTAKANLSPVKVTWEQPTEEEEEEYASFKWETMPFKKQHHDFWNIVEVSEPHVNRYNCFALKKFVIRNQHIPIGSKEAAFVYVSELDGQAKMYFPERENRFKNNVPYRYLWNYNNIGECENLIVQKSNKDMIVTAMLTPCVIATQAEHIKIFDEEVVNKINTISKSPWIWYGSDDDGVKKCKEITGCNKYKYINTPKKLLPDVNDTYSFVKWYNLRNPGTGLKEMQEFMKHKKLLK